jgi:Rad3-related DNA helicase
VTEIKANCSKNIDCNIAEGVKMLRGSEREQALSNLKKAVNRYEKQAKGTQEETTNLFLLRQKCSKELIPHVENYFSSLINKPKEFDKSLNELKEEIIEFDNVVEKLEEEYRKSHIGKGTASAGVAVGAGVAALAPTAALAVATTFGTASTGTAIATLSGAAATNAALAWLGGGALVAGGGGMSAGSALLALAGPVGWGLGFMGIAGGTLLARRKNGKIIEEAHQEERRVRTETSKLLTMETHANKLKVITSKQYEGITNIINELVETAPNNYNKFTLEQCDKLGALKNHIESLSKLINKKLQ